MTVIAVTATDVGRETQHWGVPPDAELNASPIPRGLRLYGGTKAVAALGTNDETAVTITLSFPLGFIYLLKSMTINFRSDDLTTEFSNFGSLEYRPGGVTTPGLKQSYLLVCEGASFLNAVQSIQIYEPKGTFRHWVNGPAADTLVMNLADISGDASTAGDIDWTAGFWEYDVEQCFHWQINTPMPTITY